MRTALAILMLNLLVEIMVLVILGPSTIKTDEFREDLRKINSHDMDAASRKIKIDL